VSSRSVAVVAFIFVGSSAAAQPAAPPHLTVPRIERRPLLAPFAAMDVTDAPAGMRRVEGFTQRIPNDGAPMTERTVAYLGYDDVSLHIVFVCFDSEPARIAAHLVGRDRLPNDDDSVAVHIDTFRDFKHAQGFQLNPLGVQTDGTFTEGKGWDLSFDTVWHSEGMLTPKGYVVLFSIPFKSLRFPPGESQEWGLFLYRAVPRKNEAGFWPECSSRFATRWPQAAVVDGLEHVSPGRNLQGLPYVASRAFATREIGRQAEAAIGFDGKAVLEDSIVVDATINPDFSQVESDEPQMTVNRRFEVFFPEKRPFFLENQAYFDTPIPLLFTRRIANPLVGGRATGRVGPWGLAALVADDRAPLDDAAIGRRAWFGVARVSRDIGQESSAGAFAAWHAAGGDTNDVVGTDARAKLGSHWVAVGQSVVSRVTRAAGESAIGSAWLASVVRSGRSFTYQLDANDRSRDFRADTGFIPRVDVRSLDQTTGYRFRPLRPTLLSWGPDLLAGRSWDHAGERLDWYVMPRLALEWPRLTTLTVYYRASRERVRPLEVPWLRETVDTRADRRGFDFVTNATKRVIGSLSLSQGDGINLTPASGTVPEAGRLLDITATASVRFSRALTADATYLLDRLSSQTSADRIYTDHIYRLRLTDQFTRAWSTRAIVRYDDLATAPGRTTLQMRRNVNYDLLLTYLASPGTAIYLGANSNSSSRDRSVLANDGWQVFTKLSYLVRR